MARLQGQRGGAGPLIIGLLVLILLVLAYIFLLAPALDLPGANNAIIS